MYNLKWLSFKARPNVLNDNEVSWDGIVLDISALKNAQLDLERKNKELRQIEEEIKQANKELKSVNKELSNKNNELVLAFNRIQENEEKYRQLFNQMFIGFMVFEPIKNKNGEIVDFKYININPAFEKHTGINPHNIVGKTMTQVSGTIDIEWKHLFISTFSTGKAQRFEKHSKTQQRFLAASLFKANDKQLAMVFEDISEKKRQEEELKIRERNYREIFNGTHEAMIIRDAHTGTVVDVNQAVLDLFGISYDQALKLLPEEVAANPEKLNLKVAQQK
ncbi:MAG: PAS domain S-box protein [Bacteroidales bacterium]|nr:PAS domain S-box protein [Bacteroidales bacterium]